MEHELKTPKDCDPRKDDAFHTNCPICDGGLAVCKNCGNAESQLDEQPLCFAHLTNTMANIAEFHTAFGIPIAPDPSLPGYQKFIRDRLSWYFGKLRVLAAIMHSDAKIHKGDNTLIIRMQLMTEELAEVCEALMEGDLQNTLHELTDLSYVVDGTFLSLGLQDYFLPAHKVVHEANMSKLIDGKPVIDGAGRVQKGPNFKKANMKEVL